MLMNSQQFMITTCVVLLAVCSSTVSTTTTSCRVCEIVTDACGVAYGGFVDPKRFDDNGFL